LILLDRFERQAEARASDSSSLAEQLYEAEFAPCRRSSCPASGGTSVFETTV
jgi:hypothetical protein